MPPAPSPRVTVVGAGLAGSEAAWQLAIRGIPVTLLEMRPRRTGPAHHGADFAELVCSNSLRSDDPATAAGLLKRELAALGSLIVECARAESVPAGSALAVDRERFSSRVTATLEGHPLVRVERVEATGLPEGPSVVATGPLTSDAFASALSQVVGSDRLAFWDAAAPIVASETIDRGVAFGASRWGKGEGDDYLNCPLDRAGYDSLVEALVGAQRVEARTFERRELFSACQPVEEIARTGHDALRFGPLKPVGLVDPATGRRPWAVVQLRAEDRAGSAYNLVGFQTNLTFPEQRRVFRLIPGLEDAEFLRYGVMHRNTFVDAPRLVTPDLALRSRPGMRLAGQILGTEGYLEAAGTGLLAALATVASLRGRDPVVLPPTTALGALVGHATCPDTVGYQPMHVNFGIIPPLEPPVRSKKDRYAAYAARSLQDLSAFLTSHPELLGDVR
ncbi:MAG: methylenetetrahydrofolate--tRNA-(uracil(54)-C(5))-methyltransferase (FADH(2)-oxidizing) TrmFO [Coriobacteriia bacterium]